MLKAYNCVSVLTETYLKPDFNIDTGIFKVGTVSINVYELGLKLVRVILILIAMYVVIKLGSSLINKSVEKQNKLRFSLNEKKSKTIGAVLKSILRYAVYFFGIVGILTQLFGTISLTFASIGGVAIGFGAQSLIKDILNGFFILFEDHFAVGDYITIETRSGIVESIELRVTKVRDFNGDLHVIPNGRIMEVTNHSRGATRITVEVSITYEESIDKTIDAINKACEVFIKENKDIIEPPKVVGVTGLTVNGVVIKVAGKVKAMKHWDNENKLRKMIKESLDKENIEITYNKIQYTNQQGK
ncbi:MAG: mechanosensitive ion channel family protein [Bacillota bacterium]|nr:mechanosensitive ion channel family protein [Bacillota bacterium]